MARLLSLVVTLFVGLLALASSASAQTEIDYKPSSIDNGSFLSVAGDVVSTADDITVTETPLSLTISRAGGTVRAQFANQCVPFNVAAASVTCPAAQGIAIDLGAGNDSLTTVNVTTPIQAAGGTENDVLRGGAGADVLTGGDGVDTLIGGGGIDEYFGETGNDTVNSRDGLAERISCGTGADLVDNDFTDIIAECERGTDTDGDGFSTAVDCNDGVPSIFPGAPEILENGIDENCNGVDDRNLDRDGDGFPLPGDCNDASAAIHPGALEVRGNQVDENCDRRAEPFAVLPSLVSATWRLTANASLLRKLVVRNAPKGAGIVLTCDGPGCTFKKAKRLTVKRDLDPVGLDRFFGGGKRLRPGATVKVAITAAQAIGRTYTWKIKRNEVPTADIVCLEPGAKRGQAC